MNALKLPNVVKCSIQRACTTLRQQNRRTFAKCTQNLDKAANELLEADKYFSDLVQSKCVQGSLYAGTGQYYHTPGHERVVILNFEEDFLQNPEATLFDVQNIETISVKSEHVDSLKECIGNAATAKMFPLYDGELDHINVAPWQYGFTVKPFSIFSEDERICYFHDGAIHTSVHGSAEVFDVKEIKFVGLFVSAEPFNERRMVLGLNERTNDVGSGEEDRTVPKMKNLITVTKNHVSCDLAEIAMDTEWMMKAVALLVKNCQHFGNTDCIMQVSPVLLPENNEFVKMRHEKWMAMIQNFNPEK